MMADETRQTTPATATSDEPRAIIRAFAAAMERKLAANDATKGGWRDEVVSALFQRLNDELWELNQALAIWRQVREANAQEAAQDVLMEAADVANFLLMLCDVIGALPPTDERGR